MEWMPDGGEPTTETTGSNAGSLSRREFATRIGGGSAAVFGMAWAAPKISTIKYAMRAQAGSPPPPTSTTTTTTGGNPRPRGRLQLSVSSACVGDTCVLVGIGFAANSAVTLEVGSSSHVIGVLTADGNGEVHSTFQLQDDLPRGPRRIRCVGIAPGGRALIVTAPLNIKDQGDCDTGPQGSTSPTSVSGTTATSTTPTTTPTPTTRVSPINTQGGGPPPSQGNGLLAFTGTDAADLAVLGIAAAVGGRALYALARNADDGDEEE